MRMNLEPRMSYFVRICIHSVDKELFGWENIV